MDTFSVPSGAAARVCIIDSTMRIHDMPTSLLLEPPMDGLEKLPSIGSWSFLVKSSTGESVLFDLGAAADIETSLPLVAGQIEQLKVKIEVEKNVADILKENGIDPGTIKSVIWSHWHWDHTGDMTTFPSTTELVVGPGFVDAYFPGYPTHPESNIHERSFKDRPVREIKFEGPGIVDACGFRALDFFGDGSFYLLDTPGHATGHLAGLARTTTNPDTFIFMGADLGHHAAEIRPSPHLHIPDTVNYSIPETPQLANRQCLCGAMFRNLNGRRGRKEDEPFFGPVLAEDLERASLTIKEAQISDARDDVFLVFAHDMTIMGVVDLFPLEANEWKAKGWKEKVRWSFLADLDTSASRENVHEKAKIDG